MDNFVKKECKVDGVVPDFKGTGVLVNEADNVTITFSDRPMTENCYADAYANQEKYLLAKAAKLNA